MSQSYTIQPGDTLLQIAIDQQVDYTALLAANDKYQANPDYIRAGDILILPESEIVESIEPTYSVEPPVYGPECESEGEIISQPECKAIEVHDVVFVTGDSPTEYYCLSADHQEKIKKEVKCTDQLIQGYKQLLDDAPTDADLDPKKIEEHALRKKAWLEDAVYAGAIKVDSQKQNAGVAQERSKESPPTQHYISSKITELKQRKAIVSNYVKDSDEISAVILRNRVIKSIDSEISHWERQFNKPSSTATSNKQSIDLNNFNTKTLQTKPPRRHVVEVWLVSEKQIGLRPI
ncbi:LysM domain-containing protein [Vibrio sp. CDRSL-10 TSBA]